MRYLYLIGLVAFLFSCKVKSKALTEASLTKNQELKASLCPEDGNCKLEVFKNKTLQIKADNFGEVYAEIIEGKHLVLKFEYKKTENKDYEDGSYREEIFIELDSKNPEIEIANLHNTKLFFARWCYCKGQTGYYKINNGDLSVQKLDNQNYRVVLNFHIDKVPQIIEKIDQTFSIQ